MQDLVFIDNKQPVTSSRKVAEIFGKQHKDVLESIRDILAAENSAAKFFHETTYENRGKQYGEEKPYTRAGHSDYQIVWSDSVIDALKSVQGDA